MDMGLSGRAAVVTGGSSGIGLATVEMLLAEGAKVAFCARGRERVEAEAARLAGVHGNRLFAMACDVLDEAQVRAFQGEVVARFGGLDILINNAGQARLSTFATTTDADWEAELRLKFFSVIRPTRAFLPQLEASPAASIVCVNSLLAHQPEPELLCTAAARGGVQNLCKSLATELAPKGIRVNSILLGLLWTGQWERRYQSRADRAQTRDQMMAETATRKHIPLGRLGRPEEAASAIVYLASPLSSYITGAALDVSGGMARHA